MPRKWIVNTGSDSTVVEAGGVVRVCDRGLDTESNASEPARVLVKAEARRILVVCPGPLLVDGRLAPGGAAILAGQTSHSVRAGECTILITPLMVTVTRLTCDSRSTCALSLAPLLAGDVVATCTCGTVMLRRYALEFDSTCPRCGAGFGEMLEVEP